MNYEKKKVPVSELVIWEKNPRKITASELDMLKSKIQKYPFFLDARPILCSYNQKGEMIVFAGNQRLLAVRELGFQEVPVVVYSDLDEKTMKELAIIDNRNEGVWDFEKLKIEFKDIELPSLGIELQPLTTDVFNFSQPTEESNSSQEPSKNDVVVSGGNREVKNEFAGYPQHTSYPEAGDNKKKIICPSCGYEFYE